MLLAVLPLLVLPGLGLAFTVARRQGLGTHWVLLLAIGFTFALDAFLEMFAFYVGAGLTLVVWGHVLAMLVSSVWFVRQRLSSALEGKSGLSGIVLAGIAALAALIQQPWWFGTPDTYYHLAAARSVLATNAPLVTDPFFGTGSKLIDATSGSLQPVMAVIARLTATDMATGYPALTACGAALMVLAFWTLANEVFSSRRASDLATVAYVVGAWSTDFRVFAYPKHVSLGLAFIAIALVVRLAAGKGKDVFIALGAVGFATLSMHLGAAELVLLVGFAIAVGLSATGLFERGEERRTWFRNGRRVLAAMVMIAVSAVPVLYPRIMSLRGTSVLGSDSFRNAAEEILQLPLGQRVVVPGGFGFGGAPLFWMTVLLTLLVLVRWARSRRHEDAALLSILLVVPVLTLLPPVSTLALGLSSYMVARMVELLRFVPYLALAWPAAIFASNGRRRYLALSAGALVLALVVAVPYLASTYRQGAGKIRTGSRYSIAESQARDVRDAIGRDTIDAVRDAIGEGYPRMMASRMSGYHLMGLANVTIIASLPTHSPVFIPADEAETRRDDVNRFFAEGADSDLRASLAQSYDAEYVFVSDVFDTRAVRDELAAQTSLLEPVFIGERAALFRIVR